MSKATGVVLILASSTAVVASLIFLWKRQRLSSQLFSSSSTASSSATPTISSSAYENLIGNTPLVRLQHLSSLLGRDVFVKMESLNPGGTGKDRAALRMIQQAEASGQLPPPIMTLTADIRASCGPTIRTTNNEGVESKNVSTHQDFHDNSAATKNAAAAASDSEVMIIAACMKRSRTGGLVVEGTSGSTGISLATLCAARGHACLVVLPDDQALEKKRILEALGATVLVVPTASISNPQHYVNVARRMAHAAVATSAAPPPPAAAAAESSSSESSSLNNSSSSKKTTAVFINQFENLANFQVHYETTGPEVWDQCRGSVDAFCMSAGTGGTIGGVARCLKEREASVRVVLVDPPGSVLYHAIEHGIAYAPEQRERALKRHRYDTIAEGIGSDRLTQNLVAGRPWIDAAVRVSDQEAIDMAHYLLRTEGLWVGSSSAMNVVGAVRTALDLPRGSRVVTVICDAGQRHVTRFWNKEFVTKEWGLTWPDADGIPQCLEGHV